LKPLDTNGEVIEDENVKSKISFNAGDFSFNTKNGFDFAEDLSLSLSPSQIGNTPLRILMYNAKIDINDGKNIKEADADGRPNSFKGVYIEYAEIAMPNLWSSAAGSANPKIITRNLLVGSEGGISGTIGITGETGNAAEPSSKWVNFNYCE
jgi:hypothetical protein